MSELRADTPLLASLQVPEVTAVYLPSLPSRLSKLSSTFFLFIAPLKVVWQASSLCYALLAADTTQYTLVQVTSVPSLSLALNNVRASRTHRLCLLCLLLSYAVSSLGRSLLSTGTILGLPFWRCA